MSDPIYRLKDDPHSSHSVILGRLGEGRGRKALDVGAADGFLAERLTGQGWNVTALERDPVLAARAQGRCKEVVVADLEAAPPLLPGPFDAIVYGDVLEHLADPARTLAGLARALAQGGDVIVSVPNVAHLWVRLSLLAGRFDYTERGILDSGHLRFFTQRSLRALLAGTGLTIVRATATPAPLHAVLPPRWHGGTLAAVQAINAAAARAVPRLLGYQFVLLARRA
jgi:2-polyprenyl-3-methyl-5-hydroxy-6-metoxy-1,4-benzoquinol methylase